MNTAKTPRRVKAYSAIVYVLIGVLCAYGGWRFAKHRVEQRLEAIGLAADVNAAASLMAVSELLRTHGEGAAQGRIKLMVKSYVDFYEQTKNNPYIPAETHTYAKSVEQKLRAKPN